MTSQIGHVIDLLPTCLDAAGVAYPATFAGHDIIPPAGVSFLPALHGQSLPPRALYWEHEGNRAVHEGRWKIVSDFAKPWELYDLEHDRSELHDLAATEPARVRAISAGYDAWAERCNVRPWSLTKTNDKKPEPAQNAPPAD